MSIMKPLKIKNYGSIPHLSTSKLGTGDKHISQAEELILTKRKRNKYDIIWVTEKYDGSNVGVAKVEGKIVALTRKGYLARSSPYSQHHKFADWVEANKNYFDSILSEGERLVAEWLFQKHSVSYKIKRESIVFFDWFNTDNTRKPFDQLFTLDLPIVRVLHYGEPIKPEKLLTKLNTPNNTHNITTNEPEGMVYRLESKLKTHMLAKWVRHDFEAGKYLKDENYSGIWNQQTKY